ncbi:MAG: hypothetical protein U0M96_05305 [Eggerthellaceae bacterium]
MGRFACAYAGVAKGLKPDASWHPAVKFACVDVGEAKGYREASSASLLRTRLRALLKRAILVYS